jgi:hypothetical protein
MWLRKPVACYVNVLTRYNKIFTVGLALRMRRYRLVYVFLSGKHFTKKI